MAFAVVDTVLSGHASSVDLATLGLGLSVYSTIFVGLMGATNALNPIAAQHFGGGRLAAIGATYVQGLWMALFLSALGMMPLLFARLWLPVLHAPPEVETQVARYLHILALALPGALMFRTIYAVNTAVSRPHVVMALQLTGLALKVCLSYLLILGALGLPRYGAAGAAIASVVAFWAMFLMGFAYMRRGDFYRRLAIRRAWPRWAAQREILGLGIPMSMSYALEATSFTAITLLAARLGTTVMGGHQVVANLAALCFMLPLSLSVATATLTAQAIGAGDLRRARQTALVGMRIGGLIGAVTVLTVWTLRSGIVRLYSHDPAIVATALTLIPYLVAFHFFDAANGGDLRVTGLQAGDRAHCHPRGRAVGRGRDRRLPRRLRRNLGPSMGHHGHVADAVPRARAGLAAPRRLLPRAPTERQRVHHRRGVTGARQLKSPALHDASRSLASGARGLAPWAWVEQGRQRYSFVVVLAWPCSKLSCRQSLGFNALGNTGWRSRVADGDTRAVDGAQERRPDHG